MGQHDRRVERTLLLVGLGALLMLLIVWTGADALYAQGVLSARYENLPLGGGRLTITINVSVQRWDQLYIQVAPTDVAASFRVRTPGWRLVGIVRDEFGRSMLALQRAQPKMGLETVIVEGPEGRGRQGTLALGRGGFRFMTVTNEPTFLPVELVPPPPGGLVSPLARFDANGNNRLDDPEFFSVIDAWLAGEIDNALFFEAIDLWISQRPIYARAFGQREGPGRLRVLRDPQGFTFTFALDRRSLTPPVRALRVAIFDAAGRRVFARAAAGPTPTLRWRPIVPPANGVYVAVVEAVRTDGTAARWVEKLLVLR